ncbi:MAG TPA: tannase/feruloyl esterase family alpha/beta hydrolase [Rubrobacter sp.]|nr:tannase/feruloyl esterase family alpha/beta hydrolase [Rubrobacter sp.]
MPGKASKLKRVSVLGAEFQESSYLDDLTTAGTLRTGHTNAQDWHGLHAQGTLNPRDVPGLQADGYFPDDSKTTKASDYVEPRPGRGIYYYDQGNFYGNKKYPHDSQFVMRFPDDWNGKLVVTAPPGLRGQYANDFIISDYVLAKGYAFAATDKGNSGLQFSRDDEKLYPNGKTPGSAVAEWHQRLRELTIAAKDAAEEYYGERPDRTYATGISNAGYITRYALENDPELYDGGVEWEGPLWLAEGPNLLTFLPKTLNNPKDAGLDEETAFLWRYHSIIYWPSTQRTFRQEFDPDYEGDEAEYDYANRINPNQNPQAQEIKNAVARVSLTGDIGKHLMSLHGTLDTLLPITKTSDVYSELVEKAGRSDLHRYYRVEGGNHVDSLYDHAGFRDKLRPILPCYRAAFKALEKWVEEGHEPPPSELVPRTKGSGLQELALPEVNFC